MDSVAVTNRGIYVPAPSFSSGLASSGMTWLLVIAVLAASIFAVILVRRKATATQNATGVRPTTWPLQLGLLIAPTAIVLFVFGLSWTSPELKGFNFTGGLHLRNSLIALWLALSLYTAAFIAENVRSGIMAISKGQSEAAGALGLRPNRIMNLVVLPQALRVIIPPLISQYLNLTKNSSLAIAVGYMDITGTLMGISLNQTGRELETLLLGMLIYLTISFVRDTMLPERAPPSTAIGPVAWGRENLFSSPANTVITLVSVAFIYLILSILIPWASHNTWAATSLADCREMTGKDHGAACWGVILGLGRHHLATRYGRTWLRDRLCDHPLRGTRPWLAGLNARGRRRGADLVAVSGQPGCRRPGLRAAAGD